MASFVVTCFDFIAHLDAHLLQLTIDYGAWIYLILFLIIFCETGLVVAPFLPGDSLLFAAGGLAAMGSLNIHWLAILLFIAAVSGDNMNYAVGRFVGLRLFSNPNSRWFKRAYLERTHQFYEKYGPKAIIIARFMPIIRTFMPFSAGLAHMTYRRFVAFDMLGGILWIGGIIYAGYFFGNIPIIKQNFTIFIFVIIGVSLVPAMWGIMSAYINGKKNRCNG